MKILEPTSPEVTRRRLPGDRAQETTVVRGDGGTVVRTYVKAGGGTQPVVVTPLRELGLTRDEVDVLRDMTGWIEEHPASSFSDWRAESEVARRIEDPSGRRHWESLFEQERRRQAEESRVGDGSPVI
eukprot:COSAG01_NODE_40458_length_463_cov_1.140110_1_plen_127_part_01